MEAVGLLVGLVIGFAVIGYVFSHPRKSHY